MKEKFFVVLSPIAISRDPLRSIDVVMPVNAAAFVAVQPCSVTTKGEENCERDVGVVPHIAPKARYFLA